MNKNLLEYKKRCGLKDEEFENLKFNLKILVATQQNICGRGSALFKHIIYTLVDFEKRLKKVEDEQNRKVSGPIITKIISQK